MGKRIVRSLIFAITLVIVYYAFQVFMGYYATLKYVPDIPGSYSAMNFGSNKVAFGIKAAPAEVVFEILTIMIIGVVIYLLGSYVTKKIRNT